METNSKRTNEKELADHEAIQNRKTKKKLEEKQSK